MTILLVILEFLCGSMMFSYWIAILEKKDLKTIGDGNPGGYNLLQSTGIGIGLLGISLDFFKGYFPLVILIHMGAVKGITIIPIAIAPILGHAFSPFMKFKGGKATAVTFGVWSAVTAFEVSIVYAIILALFSIFAKLFQNGKYDSSDANSFFTVFGLLMTGIYLIFRGYSAYILILWGANTLLLVYTNKVQLVNTIKVLTGNSHKSA